MPGVHALLSPLGAAEDDAVARAEVAVFHDVEPPVRAEDDAGIHAALFGETPLAVDFEILRVHGGAVIALGGDAVHWRGRGDGVGRVLQRGEVRRVILRQLKLHFLLLVGLHNYNDSRISGMLMQRGPPRPRASSELGISKTSTPFWRRMSFVTWLRL